MPPSRKGWSQGSSPNRAQTDSADEQPARIIKQSSRPSTNTCETTAHGSRQGASCKPVRAASGRPSQKQTPTFPQAIVRTRQPSRAGRSTGSTRCSQGRRPRAPSESEDAFASKFVEITVTMHVCEKLRQSAKYHSVTASACGCVTQASPPIKRDPSATGRSDSRSLPGITMVLIVHRHLKSAATYDW